MRHGALVIKIFLGVLISDQINLLKMFDITVLSNLLDCTREQSMENNKGNTEVRSTCKFAKVSNYDIRLEEQKF